MQHASGREEPAPRLASFRSPRNRNAPSEPVSDDPAIHSTHRPIGDVEYLHDVCLVRASEIYRQAALARHPCKLGNCVLRILSCRPRQSVRPRRLFGGGIENDAGSHNTDRFRDFLDHVPERADHHQSWCRICADRTRRLFRLQGTAVTLRKCFPALRRAPYRIGIFS